MTRRWRVGILGLGHWYSAYGLARALVEYPKAELVAVAATQADHLAEFSRTFRLDAYASADDLLARPDIDIVHLAAPVVDLPDLAVRAARAGKHMVLGKPMAMTLAGADTVVEAVEAAGIICVPFQSVTRLRMQAVQRRITGGDVGDLAVLHQVARWSIAEDWFESGQPGWFADPACVPGGAFIDEGIYGIDLFRWLTGSEIVDVEARMANLVHKDIAVEDWGMATFTFANGVIATLEAAWTINSPRRTAPSPKMNSVVRLEVVGTRGEIIDQWFRDPGTAVLAAGAANWRYERQAESFGPPSPGPLGHLVECLESGATPIATVRDSRASLAAALAAYRAAREQRRVPV